MKIDQDYVDCVKRIGQRIEEWCAHHVDKLPDLKFYDHDNVMVGAAIEPLTYCILAKSPDAVALLQHIEQAEEGATIFQARCALSVMGFLEGAEKLNCFQIQMMLQGKAPLLLMERGKPPAQA